MPLTETTGTFTNSVVDLWETVTTLTDDGVWEFRFTAPTIAGADLITLALVPAVGAAAVETGDPFDSYATFALNEPTDVGRLEPIPVASNVVRVRSRADGAGAVRQIVWSAIRVF